MQLVTQYEHLAGYEHGGLQMTLKCLQPAVSPLAVFTATVVGKTMVRYLALGD